jgi:DNA polymerase-3 subunit alpha
MECIPEFTFAMRGKEKEYADMLVLEGLMSHTSTHAAGIAVANQPIANIVPCMSNGDNRDMLVTQWHKKILEAVGVYKFDILGLKTLTCLNIASKLVKNNKGVDITLDSIDIYDEKLFKFLSEGHLSGIN